MTESWQSIFISDTTEELVTHKRVVVSCVWLWIFAFMPPIIVVVCVISTGLLYCKVYAAVRHHTGTSSTEWRYDKRCKGQKIYTCYILRVCGVFSLLIANILCCFCQDHWWIYLVISFMVFHIDSCVSQFIPQSLIYCWKMRHIWQTVMDHILRNILATDWFVIKRTNSEYFFLVKKTFSAIQLEKWDLLVMTRI